MTMNKLLITLLSLLSLPAVAQTLPPSFGPEYADKTLPDIMTRVYITPLKVLWTSDGRSGRVANAAQLLRRGTGQANFAGKDFCSMTNSAPSDTAALILDFGRELHGGLRLVMGSASSTLPSRVRIRFGESVGEACSQSVGSLTDTVAKRVKWAYGLSTDDHAKRDIIIELPREGMIEIGNTAFRYVRIDLLQPARTMRIREAAAIFRYRDIPYLGSFRCSDPRLDSIWATGAYTVHLNMQEYLWDGVKRDRAVWLGDMHPEVASILAVFGCQDVVPRSLDLAVRQFPLPRWMNGMSAYSLWYLIIQRDWYLHSGDLALLRAHKDYITGLVERIDSLTDSRGRAHLGQRFLDWPSSTDSLGVATGYDALLVWAMRSAGELCQRLGDEAHATQARRCADRIHPDPKGINGLKQAAALMAIAGLISPEKACRDVISRDGAARFSTFYGYYMLEALAMAGRYSEALGIISRFWGAMLDLGATTFWEDFNLDWADNATRIDEFPQAGKRDIHGDCGAYCYIGYRHSLCHGWASGPTAWLTRHVLGVSVVEPGCRTVRIEPHLGSLDWAEGTFPTPKGIIKISHRKDAAGRVLTHVDAPEGINIIKP